MSNPSERKAPELSARKLQKLRGELWIILPFLIASLYIFFGSFRYKFEARAIPLVVGIGTLILLGMRLFHIIFPRSWIGKFKEGGLAEEFDSIKEEIQEETLKGHYEEPESSKEITFREEKKAFIAIIGCCLAFVLLGYLVAVFFVIVGTSYYYGCRQKKSIFIILVSMYLIVYVVLYKLLGAPEDYGLVLTPILESLHLI